MDTESTSSTEEFVAYRNLESEIGFKPIPTRNYMFTSFNRKSKYRELMFDGAYPLHEATGYIEQFYSNYINNGKPNTIYCISVILDTKNAKKETDTLNLCVLEPAKNKSVRIKNAKQTFKKVFKIFDNIYNSYDPNTNKDHKDYARSYRKHIVIRQFRECKENYFNQKKNIKLLTKEKESDTEKIVNLS